MLHRADSSMIWNSYLFDKNYKWLSYNLWFTYINFYKVLFFFNFKVSKNVWLLNYYKNNKKFSSIKKKKIFKLSKTSVRFSYYIDLYCIEFLNQLILLNLYFFTNLFFYKDLHVRKKNKVSRVLLWDEINHYKDWNRKFTAEELTKADEFLYFKFF